MILFFVIKQNLMALPRRFHGNFIFFAVAFLVIFKDDGASIPRHNALILVMLIDRLAQKSLELSMGRQPIMYGFSMLPPSNAKKDLVADLGQEIMTPPFPAARKRLARPLQLICLVVARRNRHTRGRACLCHNSWRQSDDDAVDSRVARLCLGRLSVGDLSNHIVKAHFCTSAAFAISLVWYPLS